MMESNIPPTGMQNQHAAEDDASDTASTASIPKTSFIHGTNPSDDDESVTQSPRKAEGKASPARKSKSRYEPQRPPPGEMSEADVGIFQKLDAEYDRAMEEREVSYAARYQSVRQSACFAVGFMAIYMILGVVFFMKQADWTMEEALFFGIYSITTVGYGSLDNPETPAFQIYTIFFILIGMATLTIMMAQVYQCVALEAGRAQHHHDQTELLRQGLDLTSKGSKNQGGRPQESNNLQANAPALDHFSSRFDRLKEFLTHNEIGRGVSVLLPFVVLVVVGAAVVGTLEGWTIVESLYFAVVSMTTVGFGDYFPTQKSSRLFCIVWLPFSIGFMSLYLGNIAAFYIRLSDRNVARIEKHLRRKVHFLKRRTEFEREAARKRALRGQESEKGTSHESGEEFNDEAGQLNDLHDSSDRSLEQERRNRVLQNFLGKHKKLEGAPESTMSTMHDVLHTVRTNLQTSSHNFKGAPESEYLSFRSSKVITKSTLSGGGSVRKPSFALRVLVQERLSEIIAAEVAGYQNEIEIQDSTLTITIGTLRSTAEKWLIPRRARRAFRAVAFEALYFVGEHGLITRGSSALFDLNPFEFHGLFAPLLAAFGDADTMEGWLASTEVLADCDLRKARNPTLDEVSTPEQIASGDKTIV